MVRRLWHYHNANSRPLCLQPSVICRFYFDSICPALGKEKSVPCIAGREEWTSPEIVGDKSNATKHNFLQTQVQCIDRL